MKHKAHIMIIDDEVAICDMVAATLALSNYEVTSAQSGKQAFEAIYRRKPDMILLDWMLPEMSGIEILRRLRKDSYSEKIPVIMLTAKSSEDNLIHGLNNGADDYISKPFSPKELGARINSLLRRVSSMADDIIEHGDIRINQSEHAAYLGGQKLELGPTEFKLLSYLMNNAQKALTRTQLIDNVWSGDTYIDERTVDVHIRRLRKSLENSALGLDPSQYIETIRGIGYRFNNQK